MPYACSGVGRCGAGSTLDEVEEAEEIGGAVFCTFGVLLTACAGAAVVRGAATAPPSPNLFSSRSMRAARARNCC